MTSKLIEKFNRITIALFALMTIAGCIPPSKTYIPTNSINQTIVMTNTPKPLLIPKTITPSMEITPRDKPTLFASPDILPTYIPSDAKSIIQNLLRDNGGCRLPCVWGVVPSKTSVKETKDFLLRFGKVEETNSFYVDINTYDYSGDMTTILWDENLRAFINFSYYQKDNLIDSSVLYMEFTKDDQGSASVKPVYGDAYFSELTYYYQLPQILGKYKNPSQILLLPFPDDPAGEENTPLFSLVLIYEDTGFLVEYLFPRDTKGNDYLGCPSKTAYLSLVNWDPEANPSLENIVQHMSGLGINKYNFTQFKSFEDSTTMLESDFYKVFTSDFEHACLQSPINKWSNRP